MPHQELSDEVLASRSLQDISCFETLVERYENRLKFYILRLTNISIHEAEDILQEVFLKAWKNLNDFNPRLKFSSWIYRIAHNETISFARRQKVRKTDQHVTIDDEVFEIKSEDPEIGELFDQDIDAARVRATLDLMNKKYREMLILKFLEDKSYEEISDILRKPMGTVATLINRAKKHFKELYKRQYE